MDTMADCAWSWWMGQTSGYVAEAVRQGLLFTQVCKSRVVL